MAQAEIMDRETGELVTLPHQPVAVVFDDSKIELIKRTIARGCTADEFELFLHQCRRTQLDPLTRQIYAIKRQQWSSEKNRMEEVMSIQVSIDGFRLIAERAGKYAGQIGPHWCGTDGLWHDVWVDNQNAPAAARVGVLRSDFKEPLYAVARFDAYASRKKGGELTAMWAKMGDLMIAKCAEALALRRAFPHELSGLYTNDEMQQAGMAEEDAPAPAPRGRTVQEDPKRMVVTPENKAALQRVAAEPVRQVPKVATEEDRQQARNAYTIMVDAIDNALNRGEVIALQRSGDWTDLQATLKWVEGETKGANIFKRLETKAEAKLEQSLGDFDGR